MKKTIIAFLALTSAVMAEDSVNYTLHGVSFTAPSAQALHNAYKATNDAKNADMYLSSLAYYTNGSKGTSYDGIYLTGNAGLKFNHNDNVTVNHLYLDSTIKIKLGNTSVVGQLNWSNTNETTKLIIGNVSDAWLDINANYGTAINVSNMTGGAIYLNTQGSLTLGAALNEGVTIYAVITDDANERTLLNADFSNWNGKVVLQNLDGSDYVAGEYSWKATKEGLQIVAIPEPTTATLSLLALAGLAARRRRK